jgi:hypothetical protein
VANNLLTLQKITNESLMIAENQLTLTKQINRQYQDQFAQGGAKIGKVINIRKPVKYVGRSGANINVEDSTETSVPLAITNQEGVDIEFTDADLALSIDEFSARYLKPAVSLLANKVDTLVAQMFRSVSNAVGTPGTTPNTNMTYLSAGVALKNNAVPMDGSLKCVVNPLAEATILNANLALFNSRAKISAQYEKGVIDKGVLGMDWYMDQNIANQVYGPGGGTPVVSGASQSGNAITTSGWTASTQVLNDGDIITFAGVNAVNPVGKQDLGALKQFAVVGNVTSNGSGQATITLADPLIPASGASIVAPFGPSPITVGSAWQNVTASPANGAAITLFAAGHTGVASPQNLVFHPDAFTLACVDLPIVGGVDKCARVKDDQLGLSIRMVRDYIVNSDQRITRLDIMFGMAAIRPEWAVRVQG